MAKRSVQRQAKKILDEEPVALVWCEISRPIPKPPKEVHRAAGKARLSPGHHWLFYVGVVVFFFVFIPMFLLDQLGKKIDSGPGSGNTPERSSRRGSGTSAAPSDRPASQIFDGDWNLTAGRLLLGWYGRSPNPKRLVLLTRDRICVAASPGRRLSPTKASDFQLTAEFLVDEARIEAESGRPRGFATFRLRFADGSWLELGRLGEPEDADHFLETVARRGSRGGN
ncbi:hypothetical protein [Streptomyces sp. A1136]|uniref:hypothetical protein n=1 Tax=Streptomyces sp. A1136 TaxID=2563102 RepID=UPI00109E3D8E|nr:hypothetical protein [Streptomyces sp. A1136]THA58032.1 hypothetical protein E6R62_06075 [Streptomyces sp. A1136]